MKDQPSRVMKRAVTSTFANATYGPVAIGVWTSAPVLEDLAAMRLTLTDLARQYPAGVVPFIYLDTRLMPSSEVRDEIMQRPRADAVRNAVRAPVVVYPGEGFGLAAIHTLHATLSLGRTTKGAPGAIVLPTLVEAASAAVRERVELHACGMTSTALLHAVTHVRGWLSSHQR